MAVNTVLATASTAERTPLVEPKTSEVVATTPAVGVKRDNINFPVYFIYSKWSLAQMDKFIQEFGNAGFLRIIFDPEGKETDRTLAIMDEETYKALVEAGYGDTKGKTGNTKPVGFRIGVFNLKENNYPHEGLDVNLFVPVPKELSSDETTVTKTVTDKLEHLVQWNIIPDKSWKLTVPLASRETGGVRGGCFIVFNPEVALGRVAMVRLLLTDTYWPAVGEAERSIFRCHWARLREENVKNAPKKPFVKKPFVKKSSPSADKKDDEGEKVKRQAILKMATDAVPAGTVKKAPTVPLAKQPVVKQ